MKFNKIIFIICLSILMLLFVKGIEFISFETNDQNVKHNYSIVKYDSPKSSGISQSFLNVVLLGLDEDEVRSDTIVFLNYNQENGKLNIMSIPRDTLVDTDKGYGKINSLIGSGGEIATCKKIEELTDLPVSFYITLNYIGFKQIIDTLGGVEIDIKTNMNYDDPIQNLHIHLKKGKRIIDGERAAQYVRYRKGNKPGTGYTFGDLDRIKVQQEFIISLIHQKVKLRFLQKLDDIFVILKRYMKTNIEISDLHLFAEGLQKLKYNEINAYTLPGKADYINNVWYFINNKEETEHLIETDF